MKTIWISELCADFGFVFISFSGQSLFTLSHRVTCTNQWTGMENGWKKKHKLVLLYFPHPEDSANFKHDNKTLNLEALILCSLTGKCKGLLFFRLIFFSVLLLLFLSIFYLLLLTLVHPSYQLPEKATGTNIMLQLCYFHNTPCCSHLLPWKKLFALSHKQTLTFAVTNKTSWRVLPRHKIQTHVPHVITVTIISELLKINSEVLTAYPQQTRITTKETLKALYLWVESWLHWILSIPTKLIIENV